MPTSPLRPCSLMVFAWAIACSGDGAPTPTEDSGASGADGADGASDGAGGTDALENRLLNGGFERGETWWRPGGAPSHAWARTGDAIHLSSATFTAAEGTHAQKLWGLYAGAVPNDSEHGLTLTDLTPGDTHAFSAQVFTHADDAVSGGSAAVLFLRYRDAAGALLDEHTSRPIDAAFTRDLWQPLVIDAVVPDGAVSGELGLRFRLADWSAGGSVYLDDAVWTSTGTGAVSGERLLVWSDEFDGDALDAAKWTRLELPAYTFNNELQRYTAATGNAQVRDGQLVITAQEEASGEVTSARLVTDGAADFTYGRMEAFAQVPAGVGTWPAFWMLPTDRAYGGWPNSGEIDVLEHVGCTPGVVYQTVHTGAYNHLLGTQQGGETGRDASGGMHLYAVDWTADHMHFTVDGEAVFSFTNDGAGDPDTWPFDQRFHLILNLAFGGDWGGWCGIDRSALPQHLRVDWVRVYQ